MMRTKKPRAVSLSETPRNYAAHNLILDRWSEVQIRMLQRIFQQGKTSIEGLDYQSFLGIFPLLERFPAEIRLAAFKAFLPAKKQAIGFREFCLTLSQILHSDRDEQAAFLFKIFDLDLDHALSATEFETLVTSCSPYLRDKDSARSEDRVPMNAEHFKQWAQENLSLEEALNCFEIIPSPEEEKKQIQCHMVKAREWCTGTEVFLVAWKWWMTWTTYVRYNDSKGQAYSRTVSTVVGDRPVEIENEELLREGSEMELREGIREGRDFAVLPEAAWKALVSWYGGGPAIRRNITEKTEGRREIDLYPPFLKAFLYTTKPSTRLATYVAICSDSSSAYLDSTIRKVLGLAPKDQIRYWQRTGADYKPILDLATFPISSDLIVELGQVVGARTLWPMDQRTPSDIYWRDFKNGSRVDVQRAPNLWVEAIVVSTSETHVKVRLIRENCIEEVPKSSEDLSAPGTKTAALTALPAPGVPGAKGVANLGNTCYISAVLQCISNTPLLRDYLRSKQNYGAHVNLANPNGFKGAMAMEVCTVIYDLWEARRPVISPLSLHKTLSKFFPQFEGHHQHDCHELLGVLLDSLHEDLSRGLGQSHSPPLTIKNPQSGQCEREAEDQWKELQGAKGSAISDLMGGQTRTTIKCRNCGDVSVLFEMFMHLALPIPVSMQQALFVSLSHSSGKLVKYGLILPRGATLDSLIAKVAEVIRMPTDSFLLCDLFARKISAIYAPGRTDPLRRLGIHARSELVAYEAPGSLEAYEHDLAKLAKPPTECESGDRLDIMVEEGLWLPGQVTNVKSTSQAKELYVTFFNKEVTSQWVDTRNPSLAPFRSRSRKETDRIMRFQVIHRKPGQDPGALELFGLPLMVTVGSWMIYQDLIQVVLSKLGVFLRPQSKRPSLATGRSAMKEEIGRTDSNRRPFSLKILSHTGTFCHICGPKCSGCEFPALKSTLASITSQNYFIIAADWVAGSYSSEEFEDESLAAARDLDQRNASALELLGCMNEFTKEEEIDSTCERCKQKTITMKMDIWRLPDILILNLKRFAYVSGTFEKIDQLVTYPLHALDMSHYVRLEAPTGLTQSTTALQRAYDLYAVVFHSGSMESGHYTTCCVHEAEGNSRWLLFDDEQVFEVTGDASKTVVSRNAYLLFYRRRKMATSNLVNLACLS